MSSWFPGSSYPILCIRRAMGEDDGITGDTNTKQSIIQVPLFQFGSFHEHAEVTYCKKSKKLNSTRRREKGEFEKRQ